MNLIDKNRFQSTAAFLAKTYEGGAIIFTTDYNHYDFVFKKDLDIPEIETGAAVTQGGFLDRCLNTGEEVEGRIARSVYGIRLKVIASPVFSKDDPGKVIGACGVYVTRLHPLAQAFDDFAPLVAGILPEGAWVGITDLQQVAYRCGTEKFDLEDLQVGTPIHDVDLAWAAINQKQRLESEVETKEHGIVRTIRIPLKDAETGSVVGTFGITYPHNLPRELKEMAQKAANSSSGLDSLADRLLKLSRIV
ncbi:MAG: hypothetical protein HPY50_04545 [Firmicutes bacterium]|nr:hypothetical protein [Bacillota bacterium]